MKPLRLFLLFCFFPTLAWCNRPSLIDYNPVADPKAIVVVGNSFRFTVLTERLVRIEESKNGQFEDQATLAVLNRALPVPHFTVTRLSDTLAISTRFLSLNLTSISQGLSSLVIVSNITSSLSSQFTKWSYGQTNSESKNLLGTIRSLDEVGPISLNCTTNEHVIVHLESLHCEWGLISRDGWAIYDDTQAPLLTSNDWWNGTNSNNGHKDIYFLGYGTDYVSAISEYTQIGGKIIMTPRQASGVWWSRWYDVNSIDVQEIVNTYDMYSLPLDVYVLDMDWHKKNSWTGYSWDKKLFYYPNDTLSFLHQKGLIVSANIHDRFGVGSYEDMYPVFAKYVGIDPSLGETIPLNLVNETWAYGLEDLVLKPVEDMGMDFWWLDWQQGEVVAGLKGGKQNPTIWTNHIRATDRHRRGDDTRAMVLGRWGGMGSHRYQVGFSGDVNVVDWPTLAYQPYFSWTASNVGFGFWSHDMVGNEAGSFNENLYTRWVQWGAWSGVMRSHDRGLSAGICNDFQPSLCGVVEPWKIPHKNFVIVRAALRQRLHFLPYIYSCVREAYDTGISLIRPMYYYYASNYMSYFGDMHGSFAQFMFGASLLVAPIVSPQAKEDNMVEKVVWLPPDMWVNVNTGSLYNLSGFSEGVNYTKSYDLRDIPLFVRANSVLSVLPVDQMFSLIGVSAAQYTYLGFDFYPSGNNVSGSTDVYEDDGKTTAYMRDKYAYTTATFTRLQQQSNLITTTIKISTRGSYPELPTRRAYQLKMHNTIPPSSVLIVSGTESDSVPYNRWGGVNKGVPTSASWRWNNFELIIDVDPRAVSEGLTVIIQEPVTGVSLYGLKGLLRNANWAKQNLDEDRKNPGDIEGGTANPGVGYLSILASSADALAYLAGFPDLTAFKDLVSQLPDLYVNATKEVSEVPPSPTNPARVVYSLALLKYAS